MTCIGELVCDDQVVLGVDGGLHVVADDPGAATAGRHRACVGISQRDLLLGSGLNLALHVFEELHLTAQPGDLFLDAAHLRFGDVAVLAIGPVQRGEIASDAGVGPGCRGRLRRSRCFRTGGRWMRMSATHRRCCCDVALPPNEAARLAERDVVVVRDPAPALQDWLADLGVIAPAIRPDRYMLGAARDATELVTLARQI